MTATHETRRKQERMILDKIRNSTTKLCHFYPSLICLSVPSRSNYCSLLAFPLEVLSQVSGNTMREPSPNRCLRHHLLCQPLYELIDSSTETSKIHFPFRRRTSHHQMIVEWSIFHPRRWVAHLEGRDWKLVWLCGRSVHYLYRRWLR